MKKITTTSLLIALLISPLSLYAQSNTGDIIPELVQEPSQMTIFLTDPDNADISLQSDSVANTYYSQSHTDFNTDDANKTLTSLDEGVIALRDQIRVLDKKYGLTDPQYLATRKEVVTIVNDIEKTKNILRSSLTKISFYQRTILKSAHQIKEIRASLDETKAYIQRFANFLYKVNNEYYDNDGKIDELKLFIKAEGNVSEQLANTAVVEQMMGKMNTLMETLTVQEKETVKRIKTSNKNRSNTRSLITDYQERLTNLQDQKKFLLDYLKLYESNKQKMAKELGGLFDTRADLHRNIDITLDQMKKGTHDNISFDFEKKYQELQETKAYAKRDQKAAPLSWPLYPVVSINRFYGDTTYEKEFGLPYYGVEIPAPQHTSLYAVDEGLVYKIANKESIGLNWMLILHKNNIMTLYLYPNSIEVSEGDIVRRGQFLGYSGGELGTKGAGFVAGGPNLTFMVVDNYEFKNPLDYMDLSVLQNKSNLPTGYKYKYLSDKYNLPRDMYAVKPVEGNSVSERRENFLKTYGVSVYRDPQFWIDASDGTNIDPDVGICIAFAESTLGQNLTTSNNIGNVGNNDRGDRVKYAGPLVGARLIYTTLNNAYLGDYHILLDYNGYGNQDGKIYASSKYNRQNNVTRCLSMIKGYAVPDDFPVRIAKNPQRYSTSTI